MSVERWEHFFKPEVRSSGRRYFAEGQVSVSQPSDTEIQAYIKGSSPIKVNLKSPSVDSPLITADCTCPASKKGQLCKHIWATLLTAEEKRPEFFDEKEEIEKRVSSMNEEASTASGKPSFAKPSANKPPPKPLTETQIQSKEAFKAKQNEYRKQQYQKQKQRLKDQKQAQKKSNFPAPALPKDVEKALDYFSENGFPMENPPKLETIQLAKKKLSKVFHPDIGGAHDEILELNRNSQVLLDFINDRK